MSQSAQPQLPAAVRNAIKSQALPPGFPADASAGELSVLQAKTAKSGAQSNEAKGAMSREASREALQAAYQASWSTAFSPVRTLITSAFALYMTGNSVQFFAIASTVTVLFMHVRSMFGLRDAFRPALKAGVPIASLLPQALVHLLLMGCGVALGLYKANILGFLPTTQSDWISFLPTRKVEDAFLRDSVFFAS